jgi:threonyl-tRNA synthetase
MDDDALHRQRHSAAHLLAEAVLEEFPDARIGIGPPIANGFYYDFELPRSLTPEDLDKLEGRVKELVAAGGGFEYRSLEPDQARAFFADQPYKLELIDGIVAAGTDEYGEPTDSPVISTYRHGRFEDLCRGPHVSDASEINAAGLKVSHVAGAYWRGDEHRPMLQRVYALLFPTSEELESHLAAQEEARRRDHRRIGEEMDLFAFSAEIGRGLPLWLPKGTIVRDELETWGREVERRWGYQRVTTPHLARGELYRISGHLPYYEEDLYAPIDIEGDEYYLRPMNCPHHHMVYQARPHSYRELPLRYAEYGTVYRYERSGQLFGLMRTRGFTQNDAHIYCTLDQAREEFTKVMRLHDYYYRALGITDFHMVLAVRDPDNTTKYHGDDDMWAKAERITREAMDESGIDYVVDVGGAAHYGPKADFIIRSVSGREFAASTNQLDLYMPGRFGLTYTAPDGTDQPVAIIHRAPLGSSERFVAYLIEHFAGLFPVWLAPEQVRIVPITEAQTDYAGRLAAELFADGFRVDVDRSDNRMQAKIRSAVTDRVPFVLVIGRKEMEAGTVSVRSRAGDEGAVPFAEFAGRLRRLVGDKSLEGAGHIT